MTTSSLYLKHLSSWLQDQEIQVDVDDQQHVVTLGMSLFDSSLVSEVVCRLLPRLYGIVAYRDDTKTHGFKNPAPDWSLRVHVRGAEFSAVVVMLRPVEEERRREVAVTLLPRKDDKHDN